MTSTGSNHPDELDQSRREIPSMNTCPDDQLICGFPMNSKEHMIIVVRIHYYGIPFFGFRVNFYICLIITGGNQDRSAA